MEVPTRPHSGPEADQPAERGRTLQCTAQHDGGDRAGDDGPPPLQVLQLGLGLLVRVRRVRLAVAADPAQVDAHAPALGLVLLVQAEHHAAADEARDVEQLHAQVLHPQGAAGAVDAEGALQQLCGERAG